MNIIRFSEFKMNEGDEAPSLLSYMCFDVDDNLLHLSTKIHAEHLVDGSWVREDISSAKFAQIRNDKNNWRLPDDAFSEFGDVGPRGNNAFLDDVKEAIANKAFAPSWTKFIECLVSGNIFALITARGASSESLRSGVEYIIYNYLSEGQRMEMVDNLNNFRRMFGVSEVKDPIESYLDSCYYWGVSSPEFLKIAPGGAANPEKGKEIAIHMFTQKAHEYAKQVGAKKVQLSFSDDDVKNVEHIEKFMRNELALKYLMQYNVFDTSKRGEEPVRTKVTEKLKIKRFGQ